MILVWDMALTLDDEVLSTRPVCWVYTALKVGMFCTGVPGMAGEQDQRNDVVFLRTFQDICS